MLFFSVCLFSSGLAVLVKPSLKPGDKTRRGHIKKLKVNMGTFAFVTPVM